jgi:hypothetical protein
MKTMKKIKDKKITPQSDDIAQFHDFYKVIWKANKFESIKFDKVKTLNRLKSMGFYRYDTNDDDFILCKIEKNIISRVSKKQLIDEFEKYIIELPPITYTNFSNDTETEIVITGKFILEFFYNNLDFLFSNTILQRLQNDKKINLQVDNQKNKYMYFQNCFVEITENENKVLDYSHLENFVWKTNILPHHFEYTNEVGNFEKFIFNLSNKEESRKKSLMSILGYLLHGFYDYKTFLVLLTDSDIDSDGEPNGRTGKTLIGKALSQCLNADVTQSGYTEIDGKTFKPTDERKYQKADIDTQLIHINDIFSWFKIEHLFTDITDGLTVRKMYEKPLFIRSKIMMSSNKTIEVDGASARDRVHIFEVANYYSDKYSPEMEFKQWFFRDWDSAEWNKFFSFLIRCCQTFFKNGLIKADLKNYELRLLIEHTSTEFINWFERELSILYDQLNNDKKDVDVSKKFLYNQFLLDYPDFKFRKNFSQKKLTKWIRKYLQFKKVDFSEARSTEDIFIIHYSETL